MDEPVDRQPPVWVIPRESETELAIREAGKTLARLSVVPFYQRVGRATLWMGGVAGVNTDPSQRERGLARRLLTFAVDWMRDQGYDWTGLFGIPNFYTRFGYASALPEHELTIATVRAEMAQLRHAIRPMRQTDEERKALLQVYEAANRMTTGTVVRDPNRWKGFLKGPGWGTIPAVIVAVDPAGSDEEIRGYAVYHKFSDGVVVGEISALDYKAYESMLAYFARLGVERRTDRLIFLVPPSHPLTQIARRYGCQHQVRFPADRDGMWQVLNLVPLMEKMVVEFEARLQAAGILPGPGSKGVIGDKQDERAVEGIVLDVGECGSVSLVAERGALVAEAGARPGLPSFALSQQTLVQLLLGYRTIQEVIETSQAAGAPGSDWLEALFPAVDGVMWWPDRF